MFTKKFFSVVTLFLVGSQLVSATQEDAPEIDDCGEKSLTSCSGEEIADTLCIKNNILYAIENTSGCYKVEQALALSQVNIMSVTTTRITDASSSLSDDISSDIAKIAIYNCNAESCERSYGFIKDSGNYYSIAKGNKNEGVTPTGGSCDGIIGTLDVSNELCLGYSDPNSITVGFTETGDYLLSGTTAATNPFTTDATAHTIPVLVGTNYMIHDTLLDVEEYCYSSTDASLMSREDNFCNETNCSKYYNCSEGTCEEDTESCTLPPAGTCTATADTNNTCEGGYAIISEALYKCTTSGSACTAETPQIGYYKAVDNGQYSSGYIICKGGASVTCSAASIETADDCNGHLGKIITSGNICVNAIDGDTGIDLTASNKYLMDAGNGITDLGITSKDSSFVVLNVDSTNNKATILTFAETTERYFYVKQDDDKKTIAVKGDTIANAICANKSIMDEYKRQYQDSCVNNSLDETTVAYYKKNRTVGA